MRKIRIGRQKHLRTAGIRFRTAEAGDRPSVSEGKTGLFICALFFFLGAFGGVLAAKAANGAAGGFLTDYLKNAGESSYVFASLGAALKRNFLWFTLAAVPGFCIAGFLLLPPIAGARGFILSFTVSVLMLTEGKWFSVLLAFALGTMLTLPFFFSLAVRAFRSSRVLTAQLGRRSLTRGRIFGRQYLLHLAVCAAVFFVASAADAYLSPWLAALLGLTH